MIKTYNPTRVEQSKEPNVTAYDWQMREIYDYEDYYKFSDGRYVKNDDYELLDYAYEYQKDALLEILYDNYDSVLGRSELTDYIRDLGYFNERVC